MIEKELKFITDFTLNKVKDLGQFFTYRKLLNSDIHPAILKYISADIDFRIYADRRKLLHQSDFDYSGFEISKYFDLISEQIKKKTKISFDDIKGLIVEAVTFNAEFTVKPNSKLKKFIFNGKNKIAAEEIKMKLDSLYYHSYFSEILNAYINKHKLLSLSSTDFESIIKKLDQSTFTEKKSELIEYALNSIGDFYNIGSMDKSKVQMILVEDFLKDKGLDDFLEKLDYNYQKQSKQTHGINDFLKVLFSQPIENRVSKKVVPALEEDEPIEFEEASAEPVKVKSSAKQTEKEGTKKEISTEDEELKPSEQENLDPLYDFDEDKEFIEDKAEHKKPDTKELIDEEIEKSNEFEVSHDNKAPIKDKEPDKNISFSDELSEEMIDKEFELNEDFQPPEKKKSKIFEPPAPEDQSDNEQKRERKIEFKHVEKQTAKKDLFSYLSNREIEKIVSTIFNDDREDFAAGMEKISESKSYEDATEILKKIFKSYNVNPYSRDAVTLTNCVSNYFEQN